MWDKGDWKGGKWDEERHRERWEIMSGLGEDWGRVGGGGGETQGKMGDTEWVGGGETQGKMGDNEWVGRGETQGKMGDNEWVGGGGETQGKMTDNEWVGEEERHGERWEIMSGLGRRRDTGKDGR